ncbi:MAG: hypothetical protein RQ826_18035 [Xanthomonadales bacterium]|nr:hypothetical protein [Xanthomonadales bacterium]
MKHSLLFQACVVLILASLKLPGQENEVSEAGSVPDKPGPGAGWV